MLVPPNIFRQFRIWLLIGIGIYIAFLFVGQLDEILEAVARLGIGGWAAVLGLSTVNFALRFLRWHYYLRRLDYSIAVRRNLLCFLGGFAFTTTPAKAGEAVRSIYLKIDGVSYTDSLAALFVERLTDLIAVIMLALFAAFALPELRVQVAVAAGLTLLLLPLIHSSGVRSVIDRTAAWIRSERISTAAAHLQRLLDSSSRLLQPIPLYAAMLPSLLAAFCVSILMYIVLLALGTEISVFLAVGIYAIGILVGALSFLPGGIGSAEATMTLLLVLAGVDSPTAIAATLICRIAALWYAVAVGFAALALLEIDTPASSQASDDLSLTE